MSTERGGDEPAPTLPLVTEDVFGVVAREIETEPNFAQDILARMLVRNPHLAERIANFIAVTKRDDAEARRMFMTAAIVYRTLESQAEADRMNGHLGESSN